MSPTHQDLSNDTTFSQIKSRVPVPLIIKNILRQHHYMESILILLFHLKVGTGRVDTFTFLLNPYFLHSYIFTFLYRTSQEDIYFFACPIWFKGTVPQDFLHHVQFILAPLEMSMGRFLLLLFHRVIALLKLK